MATKLSEFPKPPLPHTPAPTQQPSPARVQMPIVYETVEWEYRVVTRETGASLTEDELNALGKDGWELTGVASQASATIFYFKRIQA